jgi:hypothetical protein
MHGAHPTRTFTIDDAKKIGDALKIDWTKYSLEEFYHGMLTELEHGMQDMETNVTNDNPVFTGKIAYAHLKEIPDYYTRLQKMEDEAEGQSTVDNETPSI